MSRSYVMAAGAMRICSNVVTIEQGAISTTALGHVTGKGLGAGSTAPCPPHVHPLQVGAGSGGSHGGAGGHSATFRNVSGVRGPEAYDDPLRPGDMGSGGGGENGDCPIIPPVTMTPGETVNLVPLRGTVEVDGVAVGDICALSGPVAWPLPKGGALLEWEQVVIIGPAPTTPGGPAPAE